MELRLDEVHITVNKNAIPNDPEKPFVTSGIRVGTPAVTTRGLTEADMATVAHLIKLTASTLRQAQRNAAAPSRSCAGNTRSIRNTHT